MSAPPAFDDYYYDDYGGDFWLEVDKVCAKASTSAPALVPAPAPVPQPPPPLPRHPEASARAPVRMPSAASRAGARQSTLDRFVNPSTGAQQREKERPAPAGGGGHPGVRAGEGCSRQAGGDSGLEDRFMASFALRREENAVPAATPAGPAPAPTGGKGRPKARAGKGRSRPVVHQEVLYNPCAVALDQEAVKTWTYPTNVEFREYQKSMVEKALFTNTLIALPTGLGKTFIAAVVMYNFFRWFPEGKIVFTAPSRALVTQQIKACHYTVGIPQEWTIDMKGCTQPSSRSQHWKSKRVFFVTPQVLANDIKKGRCNVKQIVCLVIDEAHRASGNFAYCTAVRELVAAHVPLRILALTATPGSKHANIQNVINNLCISDLVYCDEEDSEVSRYINTRKVDLVKVPLDSGATEVDNLLLDIMRPRLNRLRDAGVIDHRDFENWTPYGLLQCKEKFVEAPPPNIPERERGEILKYFIALCSICHVRKLLLSHGIKQAYRFLEDKLKKGSLNLMRKNELFCELKDKMKRVSSQGSTQKIQELIHVVETHFNGSIKFTVSDGTGYLDTENTDSKESRIIVFSHFRGSVKEIYLALQSIDDRLIRPAEFIGQSTAGTRLKGQSQKIQQAILQKFRSGEYNILVATSIGEEGLDIIEVDLVICFDANVSPLRMIQRMGRTGRKHEGRVVVLACDGQEAKGYSKKQEDTRTMRNLLRNSQRFEYHASPRMVPHVFKPEINCVKLKIENYIPCLKRTKHRINGATQLSRKMSEEDGRLFARYFGACREDMWRPSLVAFPRFQLSPSIVHKVPHSFRTTDMLIDSMQQLQDVSFRTKIESPLQELADEDQALEGSSYGHILGQACEGLDAIGTRTREAMPEECDSVEDLSKAVKNQSVYMLSSQFKTYPIHTFSGDHVTVDSAGNVSITFVPSLPPVFVFHKDIKSSDWCHRVPKMSWPSKLTAEVSSPSVEFDHPRYATNSCEHIHENGASILAGHSHECAGEAVDFDDYVLTSPSRTCTSPRGKWNPHCSARLASPSFTEQGDVELSPRLTHYIEEGIVPDSPLLDVSDPQVELDGAVNDGFVPKIGSLMPLGIGAQANEAGCEREPSWDEKNDHAVSSRHNIMDQTHIQAEEPPYLSNVKICTPTTNNSTNLLCDSFSSDCQPRPGADISGSVEQAPKYRRLCKYGDKIKRESIALDGCHDGFGDNTTIPNRMEQTAGNKGKAKRRLDAYIDDEVELSEDADVSEDEDDCLSEDRYEDSFIDDQGEFSQTPQVDRNNGDMMGFYRQSLLTQTPLVLPSRYLDISDSSVSSRTRNVSSSETRHNSVETPKGPPPIHHIMDPSPLWYQQRSMEKASVIRKQSETTVGNCESSSKMDCRKRKLSFQQPATIPAINLEPEPALQPSSHLATGASDEYWDDDAFFEGLDLDAIEAQATEQWNQRTAQLTQKPVEPKKASDISFAPPSFDLGF